MKSLYTIDEFCQKANIGKTKAYEYLKNGQIKAVKMGNKTLIPASSIDDWINSLPLYNEGVEQ